MRAHLMAAEVGAAAADAALGRWLPLACMGIALIVSGVLAIRETLRMRREAAWCELCRALVECDGDDEP